MEKLENNTLALKLAEAILLHKGKISVKDIEAMPLIDDPHRAQLIAKYLMSKFKTKISTARRETGDFDRMEEVITLIKE